MKLTKENVLDNLDQVKEWIKDESKEEKKGITIYKTNGDVLVETNCKTIKEAVEENKASLREADLHEADLCGASLHEANLCGADLHEADLREASLHEASLRGANLCGANLCGASLCGADLCGADLCGASLCGADLMLCKFIGKTGNPKTLKQSQVEDFLLALGFKVEN